jgi:hypothetical protein
MTALTVFEIDENTSGFWKNWHHFHGSSIKTKYKYHKNYEVESDKESADLILYILK